MAETGKEQLATGSLYLTLDSVVAAGIGGIFWIIVAKLAPPTDVGQARDVVALATLLITFAGLGFNIAVPKFIAEHNSRGEYAESERVFSKTMRVSLASSALIMLGLILTAGLTAQLALGDPGLIFLVVIGALTLPPQTLFGVLYGIYQGAHQMAYCLLIDAIFLSIRLILSVVLLLAGYGALGILLGFAIGYLASVLFGATFLARKAIHRPQKTLPVSSKSLDQGLLSRMFEFSLPNYASTIFLVASTQVPILLLGIYSGHAAVAFFSIAVLTKTVVATMSGSIAVALLPTVVSTVSKGSKESVSGLYNQGMKFSILLCGVPALIFFLIPDKALGLISNEYASNGSLALQLLMISSVGTVILATCTQMLNSLGRPRTGLVVTSASSILGLITAPLMIIWWGLNGAAVSGIVAGVSGAVLGVLFLSWRGKLKTEFAALVTPVGSISTAGVLGELILNSGLSPYLALASSLLVLLGLSLLLKTVTLNDLGSLVRLAMQPFGPILGLRGEPEAPLIEVSKDERV